MTKKIFMRIISIFIFISVYALSYVTPAKAANPGETRWNKVIPAFSTNGSISWNNTLGVDSDGTIYYVGESSDTERAFSLYALSSTGEIKWERNFTEPFQNHTNASYLPTIGPDGTIYVGGKTSSTISKLIAFNSDGSKKWEKSIRSESIFPFVIQSIGPEGTIFTRRESNILALSPDGSIKWELSLENPSLRCLYVDRDGNLYCQDQQELKSFSSTGQERWGFLLDSQYQMPRLVINNENEVLLSSWKENKIISIDQNGNMNWEFNDEGKLHLDQFQRSIITNENNYLVIDHERMLLFSLDAAGNIVWSRNLPTSQNNIDRSSISQGQDGTFYLTIDGGSLRDNVELIAFQPGPNGEIKWATTFDNLSAISSPKIHSKSLYVVVGPPKGEPGEGRIPEVTIRSIASSNSDIGSGSWSVTEADNQNTFRASGEQICTFKPKIKIFPPILNQHFGRTFVFLTGFQETDNQPTDVEPSSVKLGGAEPERWHTNPHFLWLKYDNTDVEVGETSGGWFFFEKAELPLEGELSGGGCFETSKEVFVW